MKLFMLSYLIVAFGKCDNKGLVELLTELFDLSLEDKNVGETDEKFIQVLEERWNNI